MEMVNLASNVKRQNSNEGESDGAFIWGRGWTE